LDVVASTLLFRYKALSHIAAKGVQCTRTKINSDEEIDAKAKNEVPVKIQNKYDALMQEMAEEGEKQEEENVMPELFEEDEQVGDCMPAEWKIKTGHRRRTQKKKVYEVCEIQADKLTRESAMKFNESDVRRPLASAAQVAKAGNRVILDSEGGYIENVQTKERMKVRVENNTYVFDVQVEGGAEVSVTLDSGAGCSVWPVGKFAGTTSRLFPKKEAVKMMAANGTIIPCHGQRLVKFRGVEAAKIDEQVFPRRT